MSVELHPAARGFVLPSKLPLAKLREPFPPEKIGHLPKAGVTLDYVGHADVTERLLDVDPEWNWEPMGTAPDGLPMMILDASGRPIGLWIRLTVCGVTRIGFGSVAPGAFDAEKQLIGDALRNAAMRFGVALDLWRKEAPEPVTATTASRRAPSGGGGGVVAPDPKKPKVVSREPFLNSLTERVQGCPVCLEAGRDGSLEVIQWDNGQRKVCCTSWKKEDGGCVYRIDVPEPTAKTAEELGDAPIPF